MKVQYQKELTDIEEVKPHLPTVLALVLVTWSSHIFKSTMGKLKNSPINNKTFLARALEKRHVTSIRKVKIGMMSFPRMTSQNTTDLQ